VKIIVSNAAATIFKNFVWGNLNEAYKSPIRCAKSQ
jgi:hypothetical protein